MRNEIENWKCAKCKCEQRSKVEENAEPKAL